MYNRELGGVWELSFSDWLYSSFYNFQVILTGKTTRTQEFYVLDMYVHDFVIHLQFLWSLYLMPWNSSFWILVLGRGEGGGGGMLFSLFSFLLDLDFEIVNFEACLMLLVGWDGESATISCLHSIRRNIICLLHVCAYEMVSTCMEELSTYLSLVGVGYLYVLSRAVIYCVYLQVVWLFILCRCLFV